MVGDSFAAAPKMGDEYRPWYIQTTEKLQMNCENHAMIGVSQDWCFWKLSIHLKELTAEDQILVVLTHPGRFWFFDDKPQMTNPNIVSISTAWLYPKMILNCFRKRRYMERCWVIFTRSPYLNPISNSTWNVSSRSTI